MGGNLHVPPLSVWASWPAPNYEDPLRRSWMPAFAGVLQGIMMVLLGTRLWLRAQVKAGPFGLDDALLIPAFLSATAFTVLASLGAERYGMDRHLWDVPLPLLQYTALTGWAAEVVFIIASCCTKVSVLLFYRRLTERTFSPIWKMATVGAMIFTVCFSVAFVFVLIFTCRPTRAYWRMYDPTYSESFQCTDTKVLNPISGALSVFSDLYSVVLPMLMLWNLKASRRQKWALRAVFSLGFLVVAVGAVRTYTLARLNVHYDMTWLAFDNFVWSQLELQLGIVCASVPALRVFFRRYLSDPITRVLHSSRSASSRGKPGFVNLQEQNDLAERAPVAIFKRIDILYENQPASEVHVVPRRCDGLDLENYELPLIDVGGRKSRILSGLVFEREVHPS